jgi:HSP20 family molecular chaperone IbpA
MSLNQRLFTDALRDMQRAMAVFEQPFYDTARRSLIAPGSSLLHGNSHVGHFRYPATDMIETPESYELSAELPGYDKKDIKIELADDHTLVLSGSVNKQHETKSATVEPDSVTESEGGTPQPEGQQLTKKDDSESQIVQHSDSPQWWVKERVSGSFSRSFAFPTRIKAENIKASYENGILKVVVPKSTEKQAHQITIE